jgi:PAS domain S-box-containing protein
LLILAVVATVVVFAIDLVTPRGTFASIPYVGVLWLAYFARCQAAVWYAALACTILTIIGFFLSPPGAEVTLSILNRAFTIVAIWATVIPCTHALRLLESETNRAIVAEELAAMNARQREEGLKKNRALASMMEDLHIKRKRLNDSEQRFRATVESSPIAMIMIDADGKIVLVNAETEKLFGYPREELAGQPIELLIPERFRSGHPQLRQAFFGDPQTRRMGTGRELFALRKDGGEVPVQIGLNPVETAEGLFVLSTILDITEQKRAERSRGFLSAIVESSYDAIIGTNPQGIIVSWNAGATLVYGYDEQEAIGQPLSMMVPPHASETEATLLHEIESGRRPVQIETIRRHKSGRLIPVSITASPITDDNSALIGYSTIERDISETKRYEAALQLAKETAERANRSRGEFLANMSHEIRTPMTAILGHVEIMAERVQDPDNLAALETIRRNGRYLLQILNDILDLSKIDAGRLEVARESVSVETIAHEIQSLMDVRAAENRLSLAFEFATSIPATIETDPVRLRQILLNLIGNAIKFTNTGGVRVVVRYLAERRMLQFDVIDTGIGIHGDDMEKLFSPFSQADASTTRQYGGTGLGLAISRRLAHALGGNISVESVFGCGSTFTLTIDCGLVEEARLYLPKNVLHTNLIDAPPPLQLNANVLIVDDRRDIRFLAQYMIEKAGGRVVTATNGQEAIDMLLATGANALQVDLVLMDMQMPVMDGYTAARKLRERGFSKPIIALTANAMKDDRDLCLEAGCTDFISKPLNATKLLSLIGAVLADANRESS